MRSFALVGLAIAATGCAVGVKDGSGFEPLSGGDAAAGSGGFGGNSSAKASSSSTSGAGGGGK